MEFIKEAVDKKIVQKQDIGINPYLIENNFNQIEKITKFFQTQTPVLLVNGFMGTGKVLIVNQALSFLEDDVITLKYNCFETTILDDILLERIGETKMEFFRKHQRAIVAIIAVTFIAWTVGLMLLPLMVK